ncbi:3-hydroxybenzoate 6-hydroxylase 1 [Trichoderma lentiforme]|uniref:3-hydroxybenzoate 6-hydroxylase 1 n=1 Tax=Trichoderma lentiforme TaxID=1567552 RepID=A0A9P4XE33_9HYPO|nr:3-hydroxybenzoate 6-hydroxylase 1 [Trichoderma lentiforme]
MAPPTVLIIGCGVAGPVLAILLKRKGYHPIVFEKVRELGNAGASLMVMSNGLKVFNLIGVADAIKAESLPLTALWDAKASGEILGQSSLASTFAEKYQQPATGIRRTVLNLLLKNKVLEEGIEVREGWGLIDIQEHKDSVTATFSNGESVTGSFLVGCDGIKSASRALLQKQKGVEEGAPSFTGLTQTAFLSEMPEALQDMAAMRNWYGDGVHVIAYPVGPKAMSWALTQRETQEREETWRPFTADEMEAQRDALLKLLDGWDANIAQGAKSAERIIKFGLFDRDELEPEQWYSRRCVLVGDAAHPTSPHLGQGANQAMEDCYHLSTALPNLSTEAQDEDYKRNLEELGSSLSESIFRPFAEKRQPRTSILVKGARALGEKRVAVGPEKGRERDEAVAQSYQGAAEAVVAKFEGLLSQPFN